MTRHLVLPFWILMTALAWADVRVMDVDDKAHEGASMTLDARTLTIHSASGTAQQIPLEDVVDAVVVPPPVRSAQAGEEFFVTLTGGDRFRGVILRGDAGSLTLRTTDVGEVELRLEIIRSVVRPLAPEVEAGADSGLDRVLLRGRDSDAGALVRVSEQDVVLKSSLFDQERTYLLADIERLDLAELVPAPEAPSTVLVQVEGAAGSRVLGEPRGGPGGLRLRTLHGLEVTFGNDRLVQLHVRNGRCRYLSDMEPVEVDERPVLRSARGDDVAPLVTEYLAQRFRYRCDRRNLGDGPIAVRDQTFAKGLGVHVDSRLTYDLAGEYDVFSAWVGVDNVTAGRGVVRFRVLADGKEVFRSASLTGKDALVRVRLSVGGVQRLTLIAEDPDPARNLGVLGRGDWAGARVQRPRRGR